MMDREEAVKRCKDCRYCNPHVEDGGYHYMGCKAWGNMYIVEVEQCPKKTKAIGGLTMTQQSNVCEDCQYYEWDNPNALHIFYDGYCTKKQDEKDSDEIACQEFKGCNSCG